MGTYYDMATVKYWSSVGIRESDQQSTYRLSLQVHPNPFRVQNTIRYILSEDRLVNLAIYDISGRLVKTLVNNHQPAGTYTITWDRSDHTGTDVGAGVYFSILNVEAQTCQHKMVVLD